MWYYQISHDESTSTSKAARLWLLVSCCCFLLGSCGSLWQTKVSGWVLQPCCQGNRVATCFAGHSTWLRARPNKPFGRKQQLVSTSIIDFHPLLVLSWYKIGGAKAWQWGPTKCHRLESAEWHGSTSHDIVTFVQYHKGPLWRNTMIALHTRSPRSLNRFHWSTGFS